MVIAKRMFGGAGFYVDGYFMAASFEAGSLALKLHPSDREELLAIPGTSRTMSDQYINIPLAWLDDPVELAVWVSKSLSYVRSLPQRKRR
jgi:TfoX/Sxy family transcriptional regulator of competence genes